MASRAVKATSGDVVLKVRCASGLLPFVVRAIKPFRDNHPEYKFEVSALHTPPVGSVMDADLGIWASSGTSPHFTFEDLGVVPSWLCATPSFLERHSVRTVEDLDKVPLLGCSHWILRMAVNFNSVQGLRDAVLEDTGVGASLPAYTVATDIVKGRMVRVLPELTGPSLKFRLVRQKTDIPVPEVERFARWLVESWRRDMVFPSA